MDLLLKPLPESPAYNAKYRQITDHLRTLITSGDLKPGTRLPPIKTLAKQWNTNYFTVRLGLTPLANEGLIERSPGSGTFVRDRQSRLTSVGIYYGGNLWTDPEAAVYKRLYYVLQKELEERDIRTTSFIDTRAPQQQKAPLPEMVKAIEQREIQGVIGLMLSPEEIAWLRTLNLPLSIFGSAGFHPDQKMQVCMGLDRLAAEGCKSVGIIGPSEGDFALKFPEIEAWAHERGLTTIPGWYRNNRGGRTSETFGYQSFKEVWAQQVRPDGLFIYHDWVCRGAITAILELGARVPQNLRLVLYRNEGVDYLCPWVVPYVSFDTKLVATMFIDFLEKQHRSGQLIHESPLIPLQLVVP
jgi:DNA-binding LacI/PurR family transcriptional regulator